MTLLRILLLGKNGQVGWELNRLLSGACELVAPGRSEINLAEAGPLREAVRRIRPQVILNAAAYSNVERAEEEAGLARKVNADAPAVLAEEAKKLRAALIHYSTDYVFDGAHPHPYRETDAPNPLNEYGRSKLEGERRIEQVGDACFILRTSWVYSLRATSFVTKFLAWTRTNQQVRVVADQTASPTWCRALAEATVRLVSQMGTHPFEWTRERGGLYHLAGGGSVSRFDMAKKMLEFLPRDESMRSVSILPAVTADFHDVAKRPAFSALDSSKFLSVFGIELPAWEISLQAAFADHFQDGPAQTD